MGIFVITVGLQIIIIQFGGEVFKVKEHGLDIIGWAISILCGLGSLVVGLLVRVLPPYPIPAFLLADYKEPAAPLEIIESVDEIKDVPVTSPAARTWARAMDKTRTQIRVTKAFQVPTSESVANSAPAKPGVGNRASVTAAPAEDSRFMQFMLRGRITRDNSGIMVVDPRKVKAAKVKLAKSRQ